MNGVRSDGFLLSTEHVDERRSSGHFGAGCDKLDVVALHLVAGHLVAILDSMAFQPCRHGEGVIGTPLGLIQKENPDISIGSYPRFGDDGSFSTEIIVRGLDQADVDKAAVEIEQMLANLN